MLDMAIVCKEAAKEYLENIEGFEVVSTSMMNSDIFITKTENPKIIGMTQDRDYQIDLIKKRFGQDVEIAPMMVSALPYALEKGEVDGIIIDFIKGVHVNGIKESSVIDGDYTTYVLISNVEFMKTKEFKKFVRTYNESLEELMRNDRLLEKHFYNYTKTNLEKGGLQKWKVKLLNIGED
ncbi:hypothetical protein TICRE_20100 [Tissierella creatinophila DSM 6911]|uniref:Solute-binding protein family 3/N-terminal domain-containing protein n=1 Tax=Tissierella creatinophila DSM 6911 TaxID=1123403 RepID=A0A1U7M3Y3_TISCR|nr:hypothetical protein TICRE_20100 [Tissierella creatinophila DSM 6911]